MYINCDQVIQPLPVSFTEIVTPYDTIIGWNLR